MRPGCGRIFLRVLRMRCPLSVPAPVWVPAPVLVPAPVSLVRELPARPQLHPQIPCPPLRRNHPRGRQLLGRHPRRLLSRLLGRHQRRQLLGRYPLSRQLLSKHQRRR